jgi:hypothetical protein
VAVATGVFMWHGLVSYKLGMILGATMFLGALVGARFAIRNSEASTKLQPTFPIGKHAPASPKPSLFSLGVSSQPHTPNQISESRVGANRVKCRINIHQCPESSSFLIVALQPL